MENPDFKDLLSAFNAARVDYMIIGAYALAAYGHVRATKDLDVWVRASPANAKRIIVALRAFGAPLGRVSERDFSQPGIIFQIGVDPVRIDVTTTIDGVDFRAAWPRRKRLDYGGEIVNVMSRGDLIRNKKASGRLQDLADVEALASIRTSSTKQKQRAKKR